MSSNTRTQSEELSGVVYHYHDMPYVCEDCGREETFDGMAIKVRSPMYDDADCFMCRMVLKHSEKYATGEIEPDEEVHLW